MGVTSIASRDPGPGRPRAGLGSARFPYWIGQRAAMADDGRDVSPGPCREGCSHGRPSIAARGLGAGERPAPLRGAGTWLRGCGVWRRPRHVSGATRHAMPIRTSDAYEGDG